MAALLARAARKWPRLPAIAFGSRALHIYASLAERCGRLAAALEATSVDVIASGGVGSLADIEALTSLEVGGRRLAGVIVGKALYEGRFSVEEAMAACAACA